MSDRTPPSPDPTSDSPYSTVTAARRIALNEDWAATAVGLLLLALVLTGLLPAGWCPDERPTDSLDTPAARPASSLAVGAARRPRRPRPGGRPATWSRTCPTG